MICCRTTWIKVALHVLLIGFPFREDVSDPRGSGKGRFLDVLLDELVQFLFLLTILHEIVILHGECLHLLHLLLAIFGDVIEVCPVELGEHAHISLLFHQMRHFFSVFGILHLFVLASD